MSFSETARCAEFNSPSTRSASDVKTACQKIQAGWSEKERAQRWLAGLGICDPNIQIALLPFLEYRSHRKANDLTAKRNYVV